VASDDYLGEFEHLVLLAVIRLGDDAYGVPIREEIEERAERPVTFGAVYATLRRLEAKGLIESRMSEPAAVPGGRARKLVDVTAEGLEAVRRSQARLGRMAAGLDGVLDPGVP
jgi:DNA-binding PadR family transcriptional regulator